MDSQGPGQKKQKALWEAKKKMKKVQGTGKNKKVLKPRIMNDKEKHVLKMQGPVGELLRIWEDLRRKDGKNKKEMIDRVLELQKDRICMTARRPDFSKIYQSAVKYGNAEQHQAFIDELSPKLLEITANPKSHHLIIALLTYADPKTKAGLTESLLQNCPQLLPKRFGQRTLEKIYASGNASMQRRILISVFDRKDLVAESNNYQLGVEEIWEKDPTIKGASLTKLGSVMDKVVTRGLVDPTFVHKLLDIQFRNGEYNRNQGLIADLTKPSINIASSAFGAKVVNYIFLIGNEDEKEEALQEFDKSVMDIASGKTSSSLPLTIVDFTDDTSVVKQYLLAEMKQDVEEMLTDTHASKLLTHLLTPELDHKRKYFDMNLHPWLTYAGKEDWNKMTIYKAAGPKGTNFKPDEKILTTKHWLHKHNAALEFLLPSVCETLSKDMTRYAGEFVPRRIMVELLHYAMLTDPDLKKSSHSKALTKDFVKTLQETLDAVPLQKKMPQGKASAKPAASKPTAGKKRSAEGAEEPAKKKKKKASKAKA